MDNADKFIISGGNVGIGTATPQEKLDIVGKVKADSFIGDLIGNASTATKLTNPRTINGVVFDGSENITIAGDNLGSHTATETLKMNGKNINMS
jgi:hypothetical protein